MRASPAPAEAAGSRRTVRAIASLEFIASSSVDADRGPGLGDGAFRGAPRAVEVLRRLEGHGTGRREVRARGHELGEGPVEHLLDLLPVRRADSGDGDPRDSIAAPLDGQVEGV